MAETQGDMATDIAAEAAVRPDTSSMTDRQLAQAVLDRTIRARVAEVMRLAEAVVAKAKKKPSKKGKTARSGKLAKIPGQSGKKKKKKG
ncbi:hypothetical protein GRI89_09560 [Altererythrobacter salegens]|uniref:Uncharacterized protein n=1 Tax=Croceibacterium salegens TaxID=1737568 RepID=A0A6I4SUV7_9SPHN|nr:hypothetical protein [Croceibacterium salegens]MXO59785.1 hypothetical protein [Croceibacterium salegens]